MSVMPPSSPTAIESWEVLDLLTALVRKSLVVYDEDEQGQGRYRLLEPTRQYARGRLLEAAGDNEERAPGAVRDRHLEFFLRLAEAAAPELRRAEQLVWLARLDREHDNLRAALEWAVSGESGVEAGLRLATALGWFWNIRNHFREGRQWVEGALARGRSAPAPWRTRALAAAIELASAGGDLTASEQLAEECLQLARETDDHWAVAYALYGLGNAAFERRDFARATALGAESLATARPAGDRWLIARALHLLGLVALLQENLEEAAAFLTESLSLAQAVSDRWIGAILLLNLGTVAARQGNSEQATTYGREAMALCCEMADKQGILFCLHGLMWTAAAQGRAGRAVQLRSAAAALREASGCFLPPILLAASERTLEEARTALGEADFAAAWAAGQALSLEDAVRYALEELSDA